MQKNIFYYYKRIHDLGIKKTFSRAHDRYKKKVFSSHWRKKALAGNANHTWEQICKKFNLEKNFSDFFQNFIKKKQKLFFAKKIINKKTFFKNAKKFPEKKFSQTFYQEIKVFNNFDKNIFNNLQDIKYRDIPCLDIKTAWEESRFQNISKKLLPKDFCNQIESWINQNKFLLGVNWLCPMEVAIRAINFIYGFYIFKNSQKLLPEISQEFWQNYFCSLFDHAFYLENNWETSDRPNNHYISDLVGYFYLCCFFEDIDYFSQARKKIYTKILEQFDHQINPDGTCYEGSTSYHELDTELFLLFYKACETHSCETHNILTPKTFLPKLSRMIEFAEITKNLQIGDNDSGKIYSGIKQDINNNKSREISHYPDFGLTIVNHKNWEFSFRHPTYKSHQPTGHFHQDELSITLSYKNIPILVDPGSYVYTANSFARNLFRSYESHNTFYKEHEEKISPSVDLFQLPKDSCKDFSKIIETNKIISIQNSYKNRTRKLILDKLKEKIIIEDSVNNFHDNYYHENYFQDKNINHKYTWSLIFGPEVKIKKRCPFSWDIFYNSQKILLFSTDLEFTLVPGFYSPEYGEILECDKLLAKTALRSGLFVFSSCKKNKL